MVQIRIIAQVVTQQILLGMIIMRQENALAKLDIMMLVLKYVLPVILLGFTLIYFNLSNCLLV